MSYSEQRFYDDVLNHFKDNEKSKERKALKRQLKAARIKLAKVTSKVQTFMNSSPGIYIKSLTAWISSNCYLIRMVSPHL